MTAVLVLVFVAALVIGVPVSIAMGGAGMAALVWGGTFSPLLVPQRLFSGIDSFPLMAVPFFILAAELMTGGRITDLLVRFACQLIGNVRSELFHYEVRATYDTPEVADGRRIVAEARAGEEESTWSTTDWTPDDEDDEKW